MRSAVAAVLLLERALAQTPTSPVPVVCNRANVAGFIVTECAPIACIQPANTTSGLAITEIELSTVMGFNVDVECAPNYASTGTGPSAACVVGGTSLAPCSANLSYSLSGCSPIICRHPTDVTGYNVTEAELSLAAGFHVDVECAPNYTFTSSTAEIIVTDNSYACPEGYQPVQSEEECSNLAPYLQENFGSDISWHLAHQSVEGAPYGGDTGDPGGCWVYGDYPDGLSYVCVYLRTWSTVDKATSHVSLCATVPLMFPSAHAISSLCRVSFHSRSPWYWNRYWNAGGDLSASAAQSPPRLLRNVICTASGPSAAPCSLSDLSYSLTGCALNTTCVRPVNTIGYDVTEAELNLNAGFHVGVECAAKYTPSGAGPSAAPCNSSHLSYSLSGCTCAPGFTDDDNNSATRCEGCGAGTFNSFAGHVGPCASCPAGRWSALEWDIPPHRVTPQLSSSCRHNAALLSDGQRGDPSSTSSSGGGGTCDSTDCGGTFPRPESAWRCTRTTTQWPTITLALDPPAHVHKYRITPISGDQCPARWTVYCIGGQYTDTVEGVVYHYQEQWSETVSGQSCPFASDSLELEFKPGNSARGGYGKDSQCQSLQFYILEGTIATRTDLSISEITLISVPPTAGIQDCQSCDVGTMPAADQTDACLPCAVGRFNSPNSGCSETGTDCEDCPLTCPPGQSNTPSDPGQCAHCAAGRGIINGRCSDCHAGSTSTVVSKQVGQEAAYTQRDCVPCPSGTLGIATGSALTEQNQPCFPCEKDIDGVRCPGDSPICTSRYVTQWIWEKPAILNLLRQETAAVCLDGVLDGGVRVSPNTYLGTDTFFPAQGPCPQDLVDQCIACLELRRSEHMGSENMASSMELLAIVDGNYDVSKTAQKCFTNINLCLFRRMRDEGSGAWDDDLRMQSLKATCEAEVLDPDGPDSCVDSIDEVSGWIQQDAPDEERTQLCSSCAPRHYPSTGKAGLECKPCPQDNTASLVLVGSALLLFSMLLTKLTAEAQDKDEEDIDDGDEEVGSSADEGSGSKHNFGHAERRTLDSVTGAKTGDSENTRSAQQHVLKRTEHERKAVQAAKRAIAERARHIIVPFTICLTRLQISFAFLRIDFGWPEWAKVLFEWLSSLVDFDVSILAPPECQMVFDSKEESYLLSAGLRFMIVPVLCVSILVLHELRVLSWCCSWILHRGQHVVHHNVSPVNTMVGPFFPFNFPSRNHAGHELIFARRWLNVWHRWLHI